MKRIPFPPLRAPRAPAPRPPVEAAIRSELEHAHELLDADKTDGAAEIFNALLQERPDLCEAYIGRGRCHKRSGDHDRAQADFERASTLAPDDPTPRHCLALLAQERGDHDDALRDYVRAESLGAGPDTLLARARLHLERDEDFEAIEALGRCFELDFRSVEALSERARVFMLHEYFVAALADYSTCCLLQPDVAQHRVARGNAFYELGYFEHAIRDFHDALQLESEIAEVSLNLGCIALDENKLDKAVGLFGDAMRIQPDYPRAHLNRGIAFYYQETQDARAQEDLERAIELDPEDPDARFALARLFARQHRYRAAVDLLQTALDRSPAYVEEVLNDPVFEELRKLRSVKARLYGS